MKPRWADEVIPLRPLTEKESKKVADSGFVFLPDYFDEEDEEVPGWYYLGKPISEEEARQIFEENNRPFPDINAV